MQALPADGMMAAVPAEEARVDAALAPYRGQISIAAVNGSRHTVVSGRRPAVEALMGDLRADGVAAQPLNVSHAFHSALMEPMLASFERGGAQGSLPAAPRADGLDRDGPADRGRTRRPTRPTGRGTSARRSSSRPRSAPWRSRAATCSSRSVRSRRSAA